jgi:hypothetical protein
MNFVQKVTRNPACLLSPNEESITRVIFHDETISLITPTIHSRARKQANGDLDVLIPVSRAHKLIIV